MSALPHDVHWVRHWQAPGRTAFRVGRAQGGFVAEWDGLGSLWASSDGQDVRVSPCSGLDPLDESKWRSGAVASCLRHLSGQPTLHASAVALDGRAYVFLGESGAGKSTFAASLCTHGNARLLADDLSPLELRADQVSVLPGESSHWLVTDSSLALGLAPSDRWKAPFAAARPAVTAAPLAAIFVLAFAEVDDLTAVAIKGHAAFQAINESFVRLVVDDAAVHLRDLDTLARIVASAPMATLSRRRALHAVGGLAQRFPTVAERVILASQSRRGG